MRPTQKGGSVVEESTLSTGLALHKQQQQQQEGVAALFGGLVRSFLGFK